MNRHHPIAALIVLATACSSPVENERTGKAEQALPCSTCPPQPPPPPPGPTSNSFYENIDYHYVPEHLTSIEGRTTTTVWNSSTGKPEVVTPWPYNKTMIRAYDLRRVMDSAVDWPVGDFSGLNVPAPRTQYQRGVNPGAYGSTAFQVYDTGFGFQISSNHLAQTPPWLPNPYARREPHHLGGAHMAYGWSTRDIRPWLRRGDSARLRIQYDAAIDHFDSIGYDFAPVKCHAYWMGVVVLQDVTTNTTFALNTTPWLSIPNALSEQISHDLGTPQIMVSVPFQRDTEFMTMEPNSAQSWTGMFPRGSHPLAWYAAYIDGSHIRRLADRYNRMVAQENLSLPPEKRTAFASVLPMHYAVSYITVGPEMQIPDEAPNVNKHCHLGGHVKNIYLITMHDNSAKAAVGSFDELTSTGVAKGWAIVRNASQSENAKIEAWVDGPRGVGRNVASALANVANPAVNQALGVVGNHGFTLAVPQSVRDGNVHSVAIYAVVAGKPDTLIGTKNWR